MTALKIGRAHADQRAAYAAAELAVAIERREIKVADLAEKKAAVIEEHRVR